MKRLRRPHGLTLIEVIISTFIIGVVMLSATRMLSSVVAARSGASDADRALFLVNQMIDEALENAYSEPTDPFVFGPEVGESTTDRLGLDDVDDFNGWNRSPPEERNGTAMTGLTSWRRTVTVDYVDPSQPSTIVGSDLGVKRITVIVKKDGVELAKLRAVRTDVWPTE